MRSEARCKASSRVKEEDTAGAEMHTPSRACVSGQAESGRMHGGVGQALHIIAYMKPRLAASQEWHRDSRAREGRTAVTAAPSAAIACIASRTPQEAAEALCDSCMRAAVLELERAHMLRNVALGRHVA